MMINNLPEYANEYDYIVVTAWDNELWFYGAYETKNRAKEVAQQINGIIAEK